MLKLTPQQRFAKRFPRKVTSACIKHRHGITLDDYERMEKVQRKRCAICGKRSKRTRLDIDHNHKTGRIRALLCNNCNRGLGHLKESVKFMKKAIKYIQKYATN
jgi:hypothetical protein